MEAILVSVCAILFVFLFGITLLDIALRSIQYGKIRSIHRKGNTNAIRLLRILAAPEASISILLFLKYSLTALFFISLGALFSLTNLSIASKCLLAPVLVILLIIFLEYVPRMLAVHNPERAAFALVRPFELLLKLNRLIPLPQASERLASRFLRLYGFNGQRIFSEYSVNEMKMFLNTQRNKAEPDLKRQNLMVIDFAGRRVREVMVARPLVKAMEINTPLRIMMMFIQEHGYSRIPIFRGNLDNILGLLYVKDLLGANEPFTLEQYLRRPFFIPESATVQAAFQNMRRNRAHLAIVVDEYGGVDGIVTLEDLIEELIGEIKDEYDKDVEMVQKVTDGIWILEGNLTIKELNQNLDLDLPEDSSYTTVAGFLISMMDKIPSERDQVHFGDLHFSVEKMAGNKISKVSLRMPPSL
ncbi:hemolysin family protein [bacterium]|nr:hemolysin family protein [bacterium]